MTTDKSNDIESNIESDVVPFEENSHQQIEPYFVAHLFDIQENNWSFSSNSTESESSFYICDLQDYLHINLTIWRILHFPSLITN